MPSLLNEILLRRTNKILVEKKAESSAAAKPAGTNFVASFVANMEGLGYIVSEDLYKYIEALSLDDLKALHTDMYRTLSQARGGHQELVPMYKSFPQEVMDMSKARLYFNALVHYWTGGKWSPPSRKQPRPALADESSITLTMINVGALTDLQPIFSKMVGSTLALSAVDKADLNTLLEHYFAKEKIDIEKLIPERIANRENKAFILAALYRFGVMENEAFQRLLLQQTNTSTDILRLAVGLMSGDISLAAPVKFKAIKRPLRKIMLAVLEAQNQKVILEDLWRWRGRWIRLAEQLHPGEFTKRYPNIYKAISDLRHEVKAETFRREMEKLLLEKNGKAALTLAKSRPGELVRRLDHLLRLNGSKENDASTEEILKAYTECGEKVSTQVLLQVLQHFRTRSEQHPYRIIFPKGTIAKAACIDNTLPEMSSETAKAVEEQTRKFLLQRFAKLPPLGKCYIDDSLKKMIQPFALRSAAKSLRTAGRGSRFALPDADTLRLFLWWTNGRHRTDIDIAGLFFDENYGLKETIAYYELKSTVGVHSGDIVDAPKGAAEFVDFSISKCKEQGIRYVVLTVSSFTMQPYCDLPECFTGWMARQKPNSGEVFEARTVKDKLDLMADTRIAVPVIFDLETMESIWCDLALKNYPFSPIKQTVNNPIVNLVGFSSTLKAMTHLRRGTLYDLFQLHAEARGSQVSAREQADKIFDLDTADPSPFDLPGIAAGYMAD